jgi:hypothetical protein
MKTNPYVHLLARAALLAAALAAVPAALSKPRTTGSVDLNNYDSLQAAIDATPGRLIHLPPGEYEIDTALVIKADGTELLGPARIVQTSPQQSMLKISGARNVRVSELTFTRPAGRQDTTEHGVLIEKCSNVELTRLHVSENHTRSSITAVSSADITIQNCTVLNFKGPTIDDRTAPHHLSDYAFRSIDGTGIQFRDVDGGVIRDNRVQEKRLLPTKEMHDQYGLGKITIMPEKPGRLMSQEIFKSGYTNNWHQGAGIHVTGPDKTNRVIISGNYIEHAPQGIDIHADNIVVTGNMISHAMIGMKAMHGSKNVLIDGNQFTYVDLWGIVLQPGADSRPSGRPLPKGDGVTGENVDGGHIISNNIISNFGLGLQNWNWEKRNANRCAIYLPPGQLEENPPVRTVVITGNVVYDSAQDTVLVDGKWTKLAPRYNYALYVEQDGKGKPTAQNVRVYGNNFEPGLKGTTNVPETTAN